MLKRILTVTLALFWLPNAYGVDAEQHENSYVGHLSRLSNRAYIAIGNDGLTCELIDSDVGYVPMQAASVTLRNGLGNNSERVGVLAINHFYDYKQGPNARAYCTKVQEIVARSIANGGYVEGRVTSNVTVDLLPQYGGGCGRFLTETLTITFDNGVKVVGQDSRQLGGGTVGRDIGPCSSF